MTNSIKHFIGLGPEEVYRRVWEMKKREAEIEAKVDRAFGDYVDLYEAFLRAVYENTDASNGVSEKMNIDMVALLDNAYKQMNPLIKVLKWDPETDDVFMECSGVLMKLSLKDINEEEQEAVCELL